MDGGAGARKSCEPMLLAAIRQLPVMSFGPPGPLIGRAGYSGLASEKCLVPSGAPRHALSGLMHLTEEYSRATLATAAPRRRPAFLISSCL
jgi:hypothetical protein